MTAESLLVELQAAGGRLTIPDPPSAVRSAYRKAIGKILSNDLLPSGYGLTHWGRSSGDLSILLGKAEPGATTAEQPPVVPVPETLHHCHEAVKALRDEPQLLDVSADVRYRALLITQAIAEECTRRGYEFGLRERREPSFQIAIGEDRFPFTLSEEYERREVADEAKLATAKYEWQRIPTEVRQVRSGRLVLRLESGYPSLFWADRKRWTLDAKLSEVFQVITRRAATEAEARGQRRRAWEEAVPRAQQAYIWQLNRDRLLEQSARSAQAVALRAYCARLDDLANRCDDPAQVGQVREWARWGREEADRVDPIAHLEDLVCVVPAEVNPSDIQEFMPRGLSAWRPPD